MKKLFILAVVAVATVFAVSCNKEESITKDPIEYQTLELPGTSWACDIETIFMGTTVVVNDTLNIIDDHNLVRCFRFAAVGRVAARHRDFAYTWDGTTLTLLDSVGEPTSVVLTYRNSDNVFFRDPSDDEEMSQVFESLGITELTYKQIK